MCWPALSPLPRTSLPQLECALLQPQVVAQSQSMGDLPGQRRKIEVRLHMGRLIVAGRIEPEALTVPTGAVRSMCSAAQRHPSVAPSSRR